MESTVFTQSRLDFYEKLLENIFGLSVESEDIYTNSDITAPPFIFRELKIAIFSILKITHRVLTILTIEYSEISSITISTSY